jgi:hypothetical protein
MKNALLLSAFLLAFEVSSMSFDEYSGNGICINVKNNTGKTFSLAPKEGEYIAIGERKIDDREVRKIEKKDIDSVEVGVSLYGKKQSEDDNREVYLKYDNVNLLTFSFTLDPINGRQLHLKSVTKGVPVDNVNVGLFRKIGGGGITYQLVIEKDKKAIEMLESKQQMHSPFRHQERLQKIKIQ